MLSIPWAGWHDNPPPHKQAARRGLLRARAVFAFGLAVDLNDRFETSSTILGPHRS